MPYAYECQGCKIVYPHEWTGRCPNCGRYYNIRMVPSDMEGADEIGDIPEGQVCSLQDAIKIASNTPKISTGLPEVDVLLNGGVTQGGLVLLTGDSSAGKSTWLLQVFRGIAQQKKRALYISGEQTVGDIAARAKDLGRFPAALQAVHETDLDSILDTIDEVKPTIVAIDSIQMVVVDEDLEPGSQMSIKRAINILMKYAKDNRVTIVVIGHLTKDGAISGPKTLEYMVDVNLFLEYKKSQGNKRKLHVFKNRSGPTPQYVCYRMEHTGLVFHPEDDQEDEAAAPSESDEEEPGDAPPRKKLALVPAEVLPPPPREPSIWDEPDDPQPVDKSVDKSVGKAVDKSAKPGWMKPLPPEQRKWKPPKNQIP